MKLSLKAIRFVIEALEHQQKDYDRQLANDWLSEDDIADLTNGRHYLDAIKKDFETCRDQVVQNRKNVGADVIGWQAKGPRAELIFLLISTRAPFFR